MKFKKKNDILPAAPPAKKIKPPREKKPPMEHWGAIVKVWFDFCVEKFKQKPSFDGSAPRDLQSIVKSLKVRAEESNVEWSEKAAIDRLRGFLVIAYTDAWLRDNFMLHILSRQKDKVFLILQKRRENGTNTNQQLPGIIIPKNGKSTGAAMLAGVIRDEVSTIKRTGE